MLKVKDSKSYSSKNTVHHILAHSYLFYFVLFLLGVVLDIVFKFRIFNSSFGEFFGLVFLVLSPLLIFWAQNTGRNLKEVLNKDSFIKGPYKYTRTPTQLGITMLMFGFGILMNSFFIVFFSLIAYLLSRFSFLTKHEQYLTEKYGTHYIEYKKLVKF